MYEHHPKGLGIDPEGGWSAFFVELTFETPMGSPLPATTTVSVVPGTHSFPLERGNLAEFNSRVLMKNAVALDFFWIFCIKTGDETFLE